MTFAKRVLQYYLQLHYTAKIPVNIEILNPYNQSDVILACTKFYNKYYNDTNSRRLILGINPGRFGAGITGIPFTDPVNLEKSCKIKNNFHKRSELSSDFVYQLIKEMGTPEQFYDHFYIGSVSPLGMIKNGKNLNYYDSPELLRSLKPEITTNLIKQIALGINSSTVFCFGKGTNYNYLTSLNNEINIFKKIVPLPHPRWIMQYRRKTSDIITKSIVDKLIQ